MSWAFWSTRSMGAAPEAGYTLLLSLRMQASLQRRHVLPLHVRPASSVSEDAITMRLAVSTTIIEPTWSLEGDAKPDIALGCYTVDFGVHTQCRNQHCFHHPTSPPPTCFCPAGVTCIENANGILRHVVRSVVNAEVLGECRSQQGWQLDSMHYCCRRLGDGHQVTATSTSGFFVNMPLQVSFQACSML